MLNTCYYCPKPTKVRTPAGLAPTSSPDPTKIATIIEDRPLANLVPLILAFSSVLGQGWPIRIFHGPQNVRLLETSIPMKRMIESGHVTLQRLPENFEFTDLESHSAFLTTPSFWKQLAPAEHVLMLHTDSILCANSRRKVEDFLDFDFVAAPDTSINSKNSDGRLSLRNRKKMLEVLHRFTRPAYSEDEGLWFVQRLRELPPQPNGDSGADLPSQDVASLFAGVTTWEREANWPTSYLEMAP
ncbi:MAG: hypothetical protein Q9181_002895 [Wetmoreana brouardii]